MCACAVSFGWCLRYANSNTGRAIVNLLHHVWGTSKYSRALCRRRRMLQHVQKHDLEHQDGPQRGWRPQGQGDRASSGWRRSRTEKGPPWRSPHQLGSGSLLRTVAWQSNAKHVPHESEQHRLGHFSHFSLFQKYTTTFSTPSVYISIYICIFFCMCGKDRGGVG